MKKNQSIGLLEARMNRLEKVKRPIIQSAEKSVEGSSG